MAKILFNSIFALFTSLTIGLIIGLPVIHWLKKICPQGQPIRKLGPASHLQNKQKTPTMGGIIILLPAIISSIVWNDLHSRYLWLTIFSLLSFAVIGGIDDYIKLRYRNSKGISVKVKLLLQASIASIITLLLSATSTKFYTLHLPFYAYINLGYLYIPLAIFIIIGSSNAVNLTDGLDGLAGLLLLVAFLSLSLSGYLANNSIVVSNDTCTVIVVCSAIIGGILAFLWFNAHPAQVFMGDMGSLALGATLGSIAIMIKQEFVFAVIAMVFVLEALSVIIQVYYFKLTKGKRVFLMAPLHHHFEKKGWHENKIVLRFWIIGLIFAIIGLLLVLYDRFISL